MNSNPIEGNLPKPDFSLLRDIGSQDGKKIGALHLDHYQAAGKELFYIGTHHGKDFENKSHEIIGQAIHKHPPQIVIVEGLETDKGISPNLGFDPKKPSDVQRFLFRSEENIHTAEYLRAKHIPFIGGEPSTAKIFEKLQENGYSEKEAMALQLLRSVSIWDRMGKLNKEHFPEQANAFLSSPLFSFISKEKRLTFDEFKTWYEAHKAEVHNKDFLQVTAADTNPNSANPNYFQKMSAVMDRVRDEHLVNLIASTLEKYDKVLVVYGNAHQYKSAPVFEHMFGQPAAKETLVLAEVGKKDSERIHSVIPFAAASQSLPLPPEVPERSFTSKMLEYGSIALLAGAAIAAATIGIVSVPVMALVASSTLAFAGSKMMESSERKHTIEDLRQQIPRRLSPSTASAEAAVDQDKNKSWVAATRSQEHHASRYL